MEERLTDNRIFVPYDFGGWEGMNRDLYGRFIDITLRIFDLRNGRLQLARSLTEFSLTDVAGHVKTWPQLHFMKRVLYAVPGLVSPTSLALAIVFLHSTVSVWAQEVIFDNTANALPYVGGYYDREFGDQVYAAGSARTVTLLQVGVDAGDGTSADFQARLYANDGLNAAPGSLLWESPILSAVPISGRGSVTLVRFEVPMITVPDTFTWTIRFWNATQYTPYVSHTAGAAAIGSSPEYGWFHSGSGWAHWTRTGSSVDFAARVVAVPEPSSWLFLTAGLAAFGIRLGIGFCLDPPLLVSRGELSWTRRLPSRLRPWRHQPSTLNNQLRRWLVAGFGRASFGQANGLSEYIAAGNARGIRPPITVALKGEWHGNL